jgi:glycosyltransferase involved in cell wall biosynthesis
MEYAQRRFPGLQNTEALHQDHPEHMSNGVSIIICCHNGEGRLPETVRHIAQQEVPQYISWEFILVDNASTDNSVNITEAVWDYYESTGTLRVVSEPELGLSAARARGFKEAQFEYVIMCDDDNWLMPNYVSLAHSIMDKNKKIGALGGLGKIVFEHKPEKWIENTRMFAAGEQWYSSGRVKSCRIYGAGCVVRKSAYAKLKQVGFKSLLTDRKGSELSSGGDHELCYALSIMGYDIWYDERLKFLHFITKERLTWDYFIRYAKESTACFDVLTSYKMIALDINAYKFSFVVLARDFFYCFRKFLAVSAQQMVKKPDSVSGRRLHFKHIILKNKIISYFSKFDAMVKNHNEILKFKEACVNAQLIQRPKLKPNPVLSIFSLRLYRQPQ